MGVLPPFVAFKGNNGLFLSCTEKGGRPYLAFNCEDKNSPFARFETSSADDINVMLKCSKNGQFWRAGPDFWLGADCACTDTSNKHCVFQPVSLDSQSVALQCLANNKFCENKFCSECELSGLNASADRPIDPAARLVFEALH